GADVEAGNDDQRADGVGQHVAEDDPQRPPAERPRAGHEVLLLDPQHLAAHQPGVRRPGHDGDREHDVAYRVAQHHDDDHRHDQAGQGDDDVGEAHEHVVEDAADVADRKSVV